MKIVILFVQLITLTGCTALGYIDGDKFVDAINSGRCKEANMMIATSIFDSNQQRTGYLGHLEYFCYKNKDDGIRLLKDAAKNGHRWSAATLAQIGERLPEKTYSSGGGGVQHLDIDVNIKR